MIFYHATKHEFNMPDYDSIISNRTNHSNGLLGLWCSTTLSKWIQNFGKNIYSIQLKEHKPFKIKINSFIIECKKCNTDEDFIQWRNLLIKKKYSHIEIIESDDSIDMVVILDFENIKEFKKNKCLL